MTLWLTLATVATAVALWRRAVPWAQISDAEAPDFAALISTKSTALVAGVALFASLALWRISPQSWWLWVPYIAFGAPLISVDAATTWLPKRLHYLALVAMTLASIGLICQDHRAWGAAVATGAMAFLFFYLFYRLCPTLGFGDVRLAALVGAVAGQAGIMQALSALLTGTLVGAVHGLLHWLWATRGKDRPQHFAYGPGLWAGPIVWTLLST